MKVLQLSPSLLPLPLASTSPSLVGGHIPSQREGPRLRGLLHYFPRSCTVRVYLYWKLLYLDNGERPQGVTITRNGEMEFRTCFRHSVHIWQKAKANWNKHPEENAKYKKITAS
ncbi:uncharacterized protein LOC121081403 [Falco naumanni]|uniref:uncharacterized protein LOC121081403 n=1 Tax=Falco naumanni TaxID=148594 RepID=UPI001ADE9A58|nr:uncharacterized protein LOC121081403 [Falco naumanni]